MDLLSSLPVVDALNIASGLIRDSDTSLKACSCLLERLRGGDESEDDAKKILRCLSAHICCDFLSIVVIEELLDILQIYSFPQIIIHALPSFLIGTKASTTIVSAIADAFKNVLMSDRSLLVPIMGSLSELPLSPALATELSELSSTALNIVDEGDIPAVVRAVLSSIVDGVSGTDTINSLREESHSFSLNTEHLVFEVVANVMKVNKYATNAYLSSMLSHSVGSFKTLSRLDLFVLLILLKDNSTGRKKLKYTARQATLFSLKNGFLPSSLIIEMIEKTKTNTAYHSLVQSITTLCRFIVNQLSSLGKEMPLELLLSLSNGLRLAFVKLFINYSDLRSSIMLALINLISKYCDKSKYLESYKKNSTIIYYHHPSIIASDVIVAIATLDCISLGPFFHHLEEMLVTQMAKYTLSSQSNHHGSIQSRVNEEEGVSLSVSVLHRICLSLSLLIKSKSSSSSSLMILVQKQLLSHSHGDGEIIGLILAQHLLLSNCLVEDDRVGLLSWVIRMIPSSISSPVCLRYSFDLLINLHITNKLQINNNDENDFAMLKSVLNVLNILGFMSWNHFVQVEDKFKSKDNSFDEEEVEEGHKELDISNLYKINRTTSSNVSKTNVEASTYFPVEGNNFTDTSASEKISLLLAKGFTTKSLSIFNIVKYQSKNLDPFLSEPFNFIGTMWKCFLTLLGESKNIHQLIISWFAKGVDLPRWPINESKVNEGEEMRVSGWHDDSLDTNNEEYVQRLSSLPPIKLIQCATAAFYSSTIYITTANHFLKDMDSYSDIIHQLTLHGIRLRNKAFLFRHALFVNGNLKIASLSYAINNTPLIHPKILLSSLTSLSASQFAFKKSILEMLISVLKSYKQAVYSDCWSAAGIVYSEDLIKEISSLRSINEFLKSDFYSIENIILWLLESGILKCLIDDVLDDIEQLRIARCSNPSREGKSYENIVVVINLQFKLIILSLQSSIFFQKEKSQREKLENGFPLKILQELSSSYDGDYSNIQFIYQKLTSVWHLIDDSSIACSIIDLLSLITTKLQKAQHVAALCLDSLCTLYPLNITTAENLALLPGGEIDQLKYISSNGNNLFCKKKYLRNLTHSSISKEAFKNRKSNFHIQIMMFYCLSLLNKSRILPILSSLCVYMRQLVSEGEVTNKGDLTKRDALVMAMSWSGVSNIEEQVKKLENITSSNANEHAILRSLNTSTVSLFFGITLDALLSMLEVASPSLLSSSSPYFNVSASINLFNALLNLFTIDSGKSLTGTLEKLCTVIINQTCVFLPMLQKKINNCANWRCSEGLKYNNAEGLSDSSSYDPFHLEHLMKIFWESIQMLSSVEVLLERLSGVSLLDKRKKKNKRKKQENIDDEIVSLANAISRVVLHVEAFKDWIREMRIHHHIHFNEKLISEWKKTNEAIALTEFSNPINDHFGFDPVESELSDRGSNDSYEYNSNNREEDEDDEKEENDDEEEEDDEGEKGRKEKRRTQPTGGFFARHSVIKNNNKVEGNNNSSSKRHHVEEEVVDDDYDEGEEEKQDSSDSETETEDENEVSESINNSILYGKNEIKPREERMEEINVKKKRRIALIAV